VRLTKKEQALIRRAGKLLGKAYGARGGAAGTGAAKVRGTAEHYRRLALLSAASRRAKRNCAALGWFLPPPQKRR
jgi:hypothetical protein